MVEGQIQDFRDQGKFLAPIGELGFEIVFVQPLVLPCCEIGILDR